jgi:1,4-alpha-glucan branching enzyme
MMEKTFVEKDGSLVAHVKFSLPSSTWASTVHLVGDFNEWDLTSHPFNNDRDGDWTISLDFPCGRAYQFRYLIDGQDWINEGQADAYVYNQYGSDNCVLITDPTFRRYTS